MSELKAFDVIINDDYKTKCYMKADADKVIAEKEKEIARQNIEIKNAVIDLKLRDKKNDELAITIKHQKYKRCLAMAKWCEERYNYLTCLENWQMTDKEYQQVIGDYWDRWDKRWLELAEKFKHKNGVSNG